MCLFFLLEDIFWFSLEPARFLLLIRLSGERSTGIDSIGGNWGLLIILDPIRDKNVFFISPSTFPIFRGSPKFIFSL
jgi:hypothetical protein